MEGGFAYVPYHRLVAPSEAPNLALGWLDLGQGYIVTNYRDRVHVVKHKTNELFVLSSGVQVDQIDSLGLQIESVFDQHGFATRRFDDVVSLHVGAETIAALHRSGLVRVWSLSFSADLQSSSDPELSVTRFLSWQCGTGAGRAVIVHPSGKFVAVGSNEGRLRVWNALDGSCTHHFTNMLESGDTMTTLKFHPKRLLILMGSSRGRIFIMDLCRHCILSSILAHTAAVTDAAFIDLAVAERQVVAFVTVSRDKWIRLWSLGELEVELSKAICQKLKLHRSNRQIVQFGLDESEEEQSLMNEEQARKKRKTLEESPQSQTAAARILKENSDVQKAQQLKAQTDLRCNEEIEGAILLSKDVLPKVDSQASWFVLVGGETGQLHLFDLLKQSEIPLKRQKPGFVHPQGPIKALIAINKGKQFLVLGQDQTLTYWKTGSAVKSVLTLRGSAGASDFLGVAAYEKDSLVCISTGVIDGLQRTILRIDNERMPMTVQKAELGDLWLPDTQRHDRVSVSCATLTLDGEIAFVVDQKSNLLRCLKLGTGEVIGLIEAESTTGKITLIAPIANRQADVLFATLHDDSYVRVWSLGKAEKGVKELRTPLARVQASNKLIYAATVSPNGKLLCTGGADKVLRFWNCNDLTAAGACQGHKQAITALAFSPVEQVVASASLDGTIRIWNMASLQAVTTLTGCDATINCLAWHPEGTHIMAGSSDARIHVWDTKKGTHLGSAQRHEGSVQRLVVHPNKPELLLSCAEDGSVVLWKDAIHLRTEEVDALERQRRHDAHSVEILVEQKRFGEALQLTLKWRRMDLFDTVVERLQGAVTRSREHSEGADASKWISELYGPGGLDLNDAKGLEQLLMASLKYLRTSSKQHLAHWLVGLLLQLAKISDLRKVEGFGEFVSVFGSRGNTQVGRLERLKEKICLIDLLLCESQ